jgi:hypothetical protein
MRDAQSVNSLGERIEPMAGAADVSARPSAAAGSWIRDVLIIVLLAGLCLSFFWFIITPRAADRGSFPRGDFDEQFYAFSVFEARELSAGRLPLWNPYTFAGHPFEADIQAAIFYPFSLLTLAASAPWGFSLFALEWEAILHFFLASVFMYFFARRLFRRRGAALVSAVVFTYGGYLTSYPSQQLAVLEAGIWLPLILLFLDLGFERLGAGGSHQSAIVRGRPFVVAGLAWGASLLAGHPQTSMYIFYTATLYGAFSAWRFRVSWRSALAALVGFQALGFALAAVQWVPGVEYMQLSTRAKIGYNEVSGGFPRQDVLQLLLPGSVSIMSPLYVGILPLLLALLAPILRRGAQVIFWSALALASLCVSFGGNTFVYSLFYLVAPGFGLFRSQERAAFILSFALALLAGYGALALWGPLTRAPKRRLNGFVSVGGYVTAASLLLVALSFYGWLDAQWKADSPFGPALTRAVLLALLVALSTVVLVLRQRRRVHRGLWIGLVVALIVFDLFTVNWRNNLSDLKLDAHWPADPLVSVPMQDTDVFRTYNESQLPGNYGCVYNLEEAWGASPLRLQTYDALWTSVPIERVWALLNVKYVLSWRKTLAAPSERLGDEPKSSKETTYLHRLNAVGPRVYVAYTAHTADDAAALKYLSDPKADPFSDAVVSEPLPFELKGTAGGTPAARITILRRAPGRIALDVSLPADGLLVLSEVYYPGWGATVDGADAKILRAQETLRSIPLRAGDHHVELAFQPSSFTLGGAISAIALLCVVALIALGTRAGRPQHLVATGDPTSTRSTRFARSD